MDVTGLPTDVKYLIDKTKVTDAKEIPVTKGAATLAVAAKDIEYVTAVKVTGIEGTNSIKDNSDGLSAASALLATVAEADGKKSEKLTDNKFVKAGAVITISRDGSSIAKDANIDLKTGKTVLANLANDKLTATYTVKAADAKAGVLALSAKINEVDETIEVYLDGKKLDTFREDDVLRVTLNGLTERVNNETVSYTLVWKNAEGKYIPDGLSVTPAADGSATVAVNALNAAKDEAGTKIEVYRAYSVAPSGVWAAFYGLDDGVGDSTKVISGTGYVPVSMGDAARTIYVEGTAAMLAAKDSKVELENRQTVKAGALNATKFTYKYVVGKNLGATDFKKLVEFTSNTVTGAWNTAKADDLTKAGMKADISVINVQFDADTKDDVVFNVKSFTARNPGEDTLTTAKGGVTVKVDKKTGPSGTVVLEATITPTDGKNIKLNTVDETYDLVVDVKDVEFTIEMTMTARTKTAGETTADRDAANAAVTAAKAALEAVSPITLVNGEGDANYYGNSDAVEADAGKTEALKAVLDSLEADGVVAVTAACTESTAVENGIDGDHDGTPGVYTLTYTLAGDVKGTTSNLGSTDTQAVITVNVTPLAFSETAAGKTAKANVDAAAAAVGGTLAGLEVTANDVNLTEEEVIAAIKKAVEDKIKALSDDGAKAVTVEEPTATANGAFDAGAGTMTVTIKLVDGTSTSVDKTITVAVTGITKV